jgi:hypothetical protein
MAGAFFRFGRLLARAAKLPVSARAGLILNQKGSSKTDGSG